MKIHNVIQGTPEWHALRSDYFTASEAPAMMGVSKQISRTELLHAKKTGLDKDVHWWVQKYLFDRGHEVEALARPIIERMIGEDLYPVVGSLGNLLASMDGMTMLVDVLFEHKMWNEELAEQVRAGDLEPHYYWQLEQQLYVSKAERVIFTVSDGTEENMVQMEYRPVEGRAKQLIAGWKQFEEDLAAYVPVEQKPQAVGRTPETLPALRIEVTGMVTASNLGAFKAHALDVISSINRDLVTDQDFADAEKTVKWCQDVEDRLKAAKQHALSQTATIDELFRALDDIGAEARSTRLELDKLVKAMKEARRLEIKTSAEAAFSAHIAAINKRLGKVQLPQIRADFAAVMKGKRTIATLQDAADTELARLKIEANAIAEGIETNLASLRELAVNHAFLFSDAQSLVLKENDDLVALIKVRISEHETAEEQKLEQERENIRALERQKLEQEQAEARQREEQAQAAEAARIEVEKEPAPAAEPTGQPVAAPQLELAAPARPIATVAPAAPAVQQAADDGKRIKLGDISSRLGFNLTAGFLRSLGFEPVDRERAAMLYRAADFPRICAALIVHIQSVQFNQAAA